MAKNIHEDAVLVVGLGRFGSALAEVLERVGHDVLAVDEDGHRVQEWSGRLTHVVEADATSEAAMRQVGAHEFRIAVVAIGNGIEASLLSTAVLIDLGVRQVWAKAITPAHGKILERIGANHVVFPERDAGSRVAHLITETLIDFIEFDDGFAIAKMCAPKEGWNRTLGESRFRSKYGVTIVGVKSRGRDFTYAQADTPMHEGDLVIVSGPTDKVEQFAAETRA